MTDMRTLLLGLVLAVISTGCSKKKEDAKSEPAAAPAKAEEAKAQPAEPADEKPTPTESAAPAAGEPTKEMAEQRLRDMLAALEAKDYDKAMTYMASAPGIPADKMKESLARVLEIKEISAHGIDVLVAKGQFGKLEQVAPEKGARWAAKFEKPVAECYGFVFDKAEAGFHWDGKELKFIRLDDVGKLE
jgi:pyruvate/2-oxoglutarate dehydrogenase complex dihydrolipoamide acyltransferase (E2) component